MTRAHAAAPPRRQGQWVRSPGGEMTQDEYQELVVLDRIRSRNPVLDVWLRVQQQEFPAWAERHGGGRDFTPASLERLEVLVRTRYAGSAQAWEERGSDFLRTAAWYVGEVHNRTCGTQWQYHPDSAGGGRVAVRHGAVRPALRLRGRGRHRIRREAPCIRRSTACAESSTWRAEVSSPISTSIRPRSSRQGYLNTLRWTPGCLRHPTLPTLDQRPQNAPDVLPTCAPPEGGIRRLQNRSPVLRGILGPARGQFPS
jgi:hypothetical protein